MTHLKLQKLQKGDYPLAHRLSVNVLLSNSTCNSTCINHSFFTFIFAVLLRFCSCSVTLFRVRSTWYDVRGPHHFWGASVTQQALHTKFGFKVVTATYCSSDCKNSLYYRTSRDQPYKLFYKLMSSALFRKNLMHISSSSPELLTFFYFT